MLVVDITEPSKCKEVILSDSKDGGGQRTIIWALALIGNSKETWLVTPIGTSGVSETECVSVRG